MRMLKRALEVVKGPEEAARWAYSRNRREASKTTAE
jgi:hypothetical protein